MSKLCPAILRYKRKAKHLSLNACSFSASLWHALNMMPKTSQAIAMKIFLWVA
jgi:hypothetical protein